MELLNSKERKIHMLKFVGMYGISIILIIVVLSGFLQPAVVIKSVRSNKEKPAKVITKTVFVAQKNDAANNFHERDSLTAIISFNQRKIDSLHSYIQTQKNFIAQLQNKVAGKSKPAGKDDVSEKELAELKKQIKFYDWALRSQVAVTNTLTKENKNLKAKIDEFSKNN